MCTGTLLPTQKQGDTAGAERILYQISRLNRKPLPALCISKYGAAGEQEDGALEGGWGMHECFWGVGECMGAFGVQENAWVL